jgi:hypothetical protein
MYTYFPCEATKNKTPDPKTLHFPPAFNHVRQLLIKTEALLLSVRKYEITSRPLVGKNRCVCTYPFTTLQPNYYTIIQCCVCTREDKKKALVHVLTLTSRVKITIYLMAQIILSPSHLSVQIYEGRMGTGRPSCKCGSNLTAPTCLLCTSAYLLDTEVGQQAINQALLNVMQKEP